MLHELDYRASYHIFSECLLAMSLRFCRNSAHDLEEETALESNNAAYLFGEPNSP
jgi:hypothetical protein